ncbi:hypothetical protein QO010_002583 [Caulobacter ginsengisoli]|uniref:DUF2975 domain-containing protein n=1 Tax=Caulobacter ginsengisoli TaxID=400775 RepID=A0ABU0IS16_9CAUL|nr:DUF2975 domain-containing protein [Caulobacter ginsengisoli]MDQ0464799.1 hypothetical protein [Caulobacter ginsengisoli]
MTSTPDTDSTLTGQARTFQVVAYVAAVTLAVQLLVLLKLLSLISPAADAFSHGDWTGFWEAAKPVFRRLVTFLPVVCYLGGLLAAAEIFGRVSEGELFSRANSKCLSEVGSSLLWGAAATALIVPILLGSIDGDWRFGGFHLEPETWVIAVVGGAILVLGRMMARAQSLSGENASLKAELSDFI